MDSTAAQLPQKQQPQPTFVEAQAAPKNPALLTPFLDSMMIGGASLLMFAIAYLYIDKTASTSQISWAAFYLAWLVNNPHFMASYSMLYWDKRKELLSNKRFLWAAIIVPTLLIAFYAWAIAVGEPKWLGYSVNAMFFLVGWHYIKQIYGTVVVTSAKRGYYFTPQESWALKLNLFPVWFMSYFNGNSGVRDLLQYGVGYKTLPFPLWLQDVNYALLGVSLAGLVFVLFRKWVREGKIPGPAALCSFAAIYVWYLPQIYHAHFWYMIPFFHSLQYMLFVTALKKNQYAIESKENSKTPAEARMAFARGYFGFAAMIIVTAGIFFHWLPEFLDTRAAYDTKLFGTQLFTFLFITFINIHHYFIDNVIWRRDNPALKKYLTAA